MIGSNDFALQSDLTNYKSQVQDSIAALDALLPGPCVHLLLHSFQRAGHTTDPLSWAAYGRVLREIAAASPGKVGFIDLSGAYAMSGIPLADPWASSPPTCTTRAIVAMRSRLTSCMPPSPRPSLSQGR